jgi:hypothetical protein
MGGSQESVPVSDVMDSPDKTGREGGCYLMGCTEGENYSCSLGRRMSTGKAGETALWGVCAGCSPMRHGG